MGARDEPCAHELLETVPAVMRFIRDQVRRRHAGGLSLPQLRTLHFLKRTRKSSLSVVAEHLGLSLPAMSRLVNGLVGSGLARRQTVSANRRQIALTVTAEGRATLERVRGEIRLRLAEAVKALPTKEQKTVEEAMAILRKVFNNRPVPEGSPPAP